MSENHFTACLNGNAVNGTGVYFIGAPAFHTENAAVFNGYIRHLRSFINVSRSAGCYFHIVDYGAAECDQSRTVMPCFLISFADNGDLVNFCCAHGFEAAVFDSNVIESTVGGLNPSGFAFNGDIFDQAVGIHNESRIIDNEELKSFSVQVVKEGSVTDVSGSFIQGVTVPGNVFKVGEGGHGEIACSISAGQLGIYRGNIFNGAAVIGVIEFAAGKVTAVDSNAVIGGEFDISPVHIDIIEGTSGNFDEAAVEYSGACYAGKVDTSAVHICIDEGTVGAEVDPCAFADNGI